MGAEKNHCDRGKSRIFRDASGLTLLELLVTVTILGIVMISLNQVLGSAVSAYGDIKNKQELLAQARYAMERMVMFVGESDAIIEPDNDSDHDVLQVSERMLDTYDNSTYAYTIDGDSILDADNDGDGLVNEDDTDPPDPREFITFDLDKAEAGNWKLREQMPDYGTAGLADFTASKVICEHVTVFTCNRLSLSLVGIELSVNNGRSEVSLKTRVQARLLDE